MKKKKSLELILNKEKISELNSLGKEIIIGGQSYSSPCGGCSNTGGSGGGGTYTDFCLPTDACGGTSGWCTTFDGGC